MWIGRGPDGTLRMSPYGGPALYGAREEQFEGLGAPNGAGDGLIKRGFFVRTRHARPFVT